MKNENLFNFITFLLFTMIIVLSISVFNSKYVINIDKDNLAKLFTNNLVFKNIFKNNTNNIIVNENIEFIKNNDGYITNDSNINAIYDGVILLCNYSNIVITQNDGYTVYFNGIFECNVKNNDYVERGSIIATYYEPFSIYFENKEKRFTYEEYLENSIKNGH